MRVIAGQFRGRRLVTVRGEIRPTSDRLRESLFSVLQKEISGSTWLDLFAGTGAVGIEALSRGARHVIFNDKSSTGRDLVRRNLEVCGIREGFEIWAQDAFSALRGNRSSSVGITHFFLDPPYRFGRQGKLLAKILQSPFWTDDSLILLEIFKKRAADFVPDPLRVDRRLEVGDSHLLFLRAVPSEVDPSSGTDSSSGTLPEERPDEADDQKQ